MKRYDHKAIEKKWQNVWDKKGLYRTADTKKETKNFYLLVEFPYPSGNLHVGHWYAFAVPDILARMFRMQGRNVLYPIGFDAFGLPAENAAIKNKINPRLWTERNIAYMKKQVRSMGTSFDWSREVVTCDPAYYKWTQWQFNQFLKKGLAYRKETAVNWCPSCKTVLANEQVVDGKCERCGTGVVQKEMLQWNLKITDYADRLVDDLEKLDWPEPIKEAQRAWIGRSQGAEIDFPLDTGQKYKYVILHGFQSTPDAPRWIWAKEKLEKMGHEVILPRLPNPDNPSEEKWVLTALNSTTFDENTILVGHSLGAVAALKVLEKLDKPIARLVTVGGFCSPRFKDKSRMFEKTWTWTFDAKKIRNNAHSVTILHDPRDYAVGEEQAKELSELLKTPITLGESNEPHFTGDTEPDVLMWLYPTVRVFTTRADTLFGVTYLVLAPEHPWVQQALKNKTLLKNIAQVQTYVDAAARKTELERQTEQKEKTGIRLEGVEAVNPATGKKIPIYVADYVLASYGTGAVMGVPAHDERDYEFAKKFNLPIKHVVVPKFVDSANPPRAGKKVVFRRTVLGIVRDPKNNTYLCLKWKKQPWTTFVVGGVEAHESWIDAARREISEETGFSNLKLVRQLGGPVRVHFFAAHKDENREALQAAVLFEIDESTKAGPISEEELEKHEIVWMNESELRRSPMAHAELSLVLERIHADEKAYTGDGVLCESGKFDGLTAAEGRQAITKHYGRTKKTYRLRDWVVSRQRYWGVPIPVIHCPLCGTQPVPDKDLPVRLPEVKDYLPDGRGKSPLAKAKKWVYVKCPKCKGKAERETDTLDTFVDSSWYFLRYTDPKNKKKFADPKRMAKWMPVDLYSGGAEHTTMHVLYSRFWHKALHDLKLVADKEPYTRRMNRSLILGPDGYKMSKSRGNVIDPDEVVARLGADTVRMYLAFIGPYNEVSSYPWNPDGVVGVRRFLERVWKAQEYVGVKDNSALIRPLHKTVKKVSEDNAALKFNTAISALMVFLNALEKERTIGKKQWEVFLRLLAPFAPHMAEELWCTLGHKTSIHTEKWPRWSMSFIQDETVTIAVQVNGKLRGTVQLSAEVDETVYETSARKVVEKYLAGRAVTRVIVVKGRLVNFVVNG